MVGIGDKVYEALKRTGADVWHDHPQGWSSLPVIGWRESMNRALRQADGREHLTELEYTVDCYARSPEEAMELADDADAQLNALRLRRTFCATIYDAAIRAQHTQMRYRCVSDEEGNVYQ